MSVTTATVRIQISAEGIFNKSPKKFAKNEKRIARRSADKRRARVAQRETRSG